MNRLIIAAVFALLPACVSGGFFTSFSGNAALVVSPWQLTEENTGIYDTAWWSGSAGWSFYGIADVYGGAGFTVFFDRADKESHYSHIPLFAGLRMNIMPEWPVFPSFYSEAGFSFANRHEKFFNTLTMSYDAKDNPYNAFYYSFGVAVSLRIFEGFSAGLRIGRLSFALPERGELHAAEAGFEIRAGY